MRPLTLLLVAAAFVHASPRAVVAQDTASPVQPAAQSLAAAPDPSPPPEATVDPTSAATAPAGETTPAAAEAEAVAEPAAATVDAAPAETPAPVEPTPPPEPQVVTARIDPELALRLSLLEKTMLAQTQGQNAIYTETTRLLVFFGTACVAMGLIAMVAAVFLMNRTLASVSAITAQVAQAQAHSAPAALGGAPALVAAGGPPAAGPTGFEKIQASGQRFQNRMTSLEQRLEELEHIAGHGAAAVATSAADDTAAEPPPEPRRRVIPLAAILVRKAEALMNLGKLHDAMAVLDEAGQLEGDPSEVHLARGRVLEKLGRLGDALQAYDLAVTTDEKNTAALLMKAGVLNRQERFDEALSCYERALAVHRANN